MKKTIFLPKSCPVPCIKYVQEDWRQKTAKKTSKKCQFLSPKTLYARLAQNQFCQSISLNRQQRASSDVI